MGKNNKVYLFLCLWVNQWKNGFLVNPQKRGNRYYADLKVQVATKETAPSDYEIILPARKGSGYMAQKEVEITEEVYLELTN